MADGDNVVSDVAGAVRCFNLLMIQGVCIIKVLHVGADLAEDCAIHDDLPGDVEHIAFPWVELDVVIIHALSVSASPAANKARSYFYALNKQK